MSRTVQSAMVCLGLAGGTLMAPIHGFGQENAVAPTAIAATTTDTISADRTTSEPGILAADGLTTSLPQLTPDTLSGSDSLNLDPLLASLNRPTTSSLLGGEFPVEIPQAAPLPIDEIRGLLRTTGKGLVRYSPMSAVMAGLGANRELAVQKLRPSISEPGIDSALSEFDPVLRASIASGETERSTLSNRPRESGPDLRDRNGRASSTNTDGNVSLGARIPTGTELSVDLSASRDSTNRTRDFYGADAAINVTQNILRGRGVAFNMARVRIARNDLEISRHQLEAYLINLVSDILIAYSDLYLARETLRIRIESWEVAGQQADQNDEFLRVGRSTPLDSLTGRAEQSSRAGDVINAAAQFKNRRLQLAILTGGIPTRQGTNYQADLSLGSAPVPAIIPRPSAEKVVPSERIRVAMALRPELPQAQLELENGELEVVRTRNGLMPRLDFTVRAGTSGVGDTLGDSYDMMDGTKFGSWRAGLELEVPLGNRSARAADRRARFNRDQAVAAIANQRQQIELDVRLALVEVERAQRLIRTTEVARRQREQSLFNERQRLNVGSGTRLEVVQAERDLIQAQIDQVSAEISLTKAYIELHRAEGSTLVRTGVSPITAITLSQPSTTRREILTLPAPTATPKTPRNSNR